MIRQRKYQENEEKIVALQQTLEALQRDDILRLIEHVKKVMNAEIIYERGSSPLSRYSYCEEKWPRMDSVRARIWVREIILDDEIGKGEIRADYVMIYLDSSGRTVMGGSAGGDFPTRWTLEKQGEDWVIVEIDEHP